MARSLEFYLGLGCEVRRAADGWALLQCDRTTFVLFQADAGTAAVRQLRLRTTDVRVLRRRLQACGETVRLRHGPAPTLETTDPDRHAVVVEQR